MFDSSNEIGISQAILQFTHILTLLQQPDPPHSLTKPILILLNKIDCPFTFTEEQFCELLNWKYWTSKYPNQLHLQRISCATSENMKKSVEHMVQLISDQK